MSDAFLEWLDEQSQGRIQIAFDRAKKRDTEWWDDESFETVLMEEVYSMYVQDMTEHLARMGYVEAHVREDGQLGYTITEKGKEAYDTPSA